MTTSNRRNRRVLHATCMLHKGPIGFVNLAVRKVEAPSAVAPEFIEFDPHVTGTCVIRLDETAAKQLFDLLGEWLR
ncbi:MAG: hypothetical protein JO272_16660 [Pseudonocardiales bacterium]|nr:hypothetical protein [Pseudonocardiales bacterium]